MSKQHVSAGQLTIKGLIVGILTLLLLIPTLFIGNIVDDRFERQKEVSQEITDKWATDQTIVGPFIMIPYTKNSKNSSETQSTFLYIMPEELNIIGSSQHETRKRSVFEVIVYTLNLQMNGKFNAIEAYIDNIPDKDNLDLNKIEICFGLSDSKGFINAPVINIGDKEITLTNVISSNYFVDNGLAATVSINDLSNKEFSCKVDLRGSTGLYFTPIGRETKANLSSTWPHPAVDGNFLTSDKLDISDSGFFAKWTILNLNRQFPQAWIGNNYSCKSDRFGVILAQPNNSYSKTDKSLKYALLFIGLTFAFYFFIEILQKSKVHPIQYVLVGVSLCVFYSLLLSISEYLPFNWAYLIASFSIVGLITAYTKSIFSGWKTAAIFGFLLTFLYAFIFTLIQLEDGALLIGSIGLFILMASIMYTSRKIDWYPTQPEPLIPITPAQRSEEIKNDANTNKPNQPSQTWDNMDITV